MGPPEDGQIGFLLEKTDGDYASILAGATAIGQFESEVKALRHENGVYSPFHKQFWQGLLSPLHDLKSKAAAISSAVDKLTKNSVSVISVHSEVAAAENSLERLGQELHELVPIVRIQIDERIAMLKRNRIAMFVQNEVMSVWLPTAFAILAITVGLVSLASDKPLPFFTDEKIDVQTN